jgi:hypothetical protein
MIGGILAAAGDLVFTGEANTYVQGLRLVERQQSGTTSPCRWGWRAAVLIRDRWQAVVAETAFHRMCYSHFSSEIRGYFKAGANLRYDGSSPSHRGLLIPVGAVPAATTQLR